ncbi:MAG: TRAP transporter substrate-binding protein, partial [Chloroflexi bacterium]|nr:TRAP transporter substrate-binding protein [Chloroflexota bacterium]
APAAAPEKPAAAPKPAAKAIPTPAATCKDAKFTWRIGAPATRPNQTVTWADKFKELIEQRTNCELSILIFQGAVLGTNRQMIEQVRLGTLEVTMQASDVSELHAPYGAVDLPFIIRDRAHVVAVLDGPIGTKLNEDMIKAKGVRSLGYGELGWRHITNSVRPISTPDDLKGMKIRVPESKLRLRTFEIFGASPVAMAFSELYTALQQRVADGQENPLSTVWAGSFFEVQKYLSLTNHLYTPVYPLINERIFQRLPPERQKLVLDTAQEVAVWHRQESVKADAELVQKLRDKGMQINEAKAADFQQQASKVWAEFAAPIGQDLIDAIVKTR